MTTGRKALQTISQRFISILYSTSRLMIFSQLLQGTHSSIAHVPDWKQDKIVVMWYLDASSRLATTAKH